MGRPRSVSEYTFLDDCILIHTKHCNFKISKESYDIVKDYRWFSKLCKPTGKYYAYAHFTGNKKILLHRHILGVDGPELVDHHNRDTTDNTLSNLRVASRLQNNVNSKKRKNCRSIYKGVTLRPSGRWGVYIAKSGVNMCLGTFDSEIDAALAYNEKALQLFGEFANLNEVKTKE
jgi:hypothetical protein